MKLRFRAAAPALVIVPLGLLASPLGAQSYKLAGPFPPGPGGGDARELVVSPDGTRVVYRADQERFGVFELFSAPTDGSQPPVKLNGALCEEGNVAEHGFAISPDSTRVVYRADQEADEVLELFSVPIDGSLPAHKLDATPAPGGDVGAFAIAADSSRVVYYADQATDEKFELWSAPLDGSAPAVRLNGTLPAAGDVGLFLLGGGGRVAFLADATVDDRFDVLSAPIDGSAPPTQLLTLPASNSVWSLQYSQSSTHVVVVLTQPSPQLMRLYSVPADGSAAPIQLSSGTLVYIQTTRIDATGTRVVYSARSTLQADYELYSAPLDGSTAAVRLHSPFPPNRSVVGGSFALTADGARVLYVADATVDEVYELWSAPSDGSTSPVRLNGTLVTGGDVSGAFGVARSNAGERVVYIADQDTDDVGELYSVPADGSGSALKLATGGVSLYTSDPPTEPFGTDHSRTVFVGGSFGLFSVPLDASAAPTTLNPSGTLQGWGFAGSRVVYLADPAISGVREVFSAPLDGSAAPIKLSASMSAAPAEKQVNSFEFSPDGSRIVYVREPATNGGDELYSVPADGSGPSVRLSDPVSDNPQNYESIYPYVISADGTRVVYGVPREAMGGPDGSRIFSVPIDRSAVPVELDFPDFSNFALSPDGAWVISTNDHQILRVPIDGSSGAVLLTPLPPGYEQWIRAAEISPDSATIVFAQDLEVEGRMELYSVPLDGSSAAVKLNAPLVAGGDVGNSNFFFLIAPDSTRVVYLADQEVDGRFELFSVPIHGGPAIKLNATLVASGNVALAGNVRPAAITADGARVVYAADQLVDERYELFSVPIAGGAALPLSGTLVAGGDVITVTPFFQGPSVLFAGERVVFLADKEVDGRVEAYSVPVAGGIPVKLNGSLVAGGNVASLRISADGRFVVYRADQDVDERVELYARRTNGTGSALKLNAPLPPGGAVQGFAFLPRGRRVIYSADQDVDNRIELYEVAISGSPPVKINGALVPRGDVSTFDISPGGARLVYTADQDTDGVRELYGHDLRSPPTPAATPQAPSSALPGSTVTIVH